MGYMCPAEAEALGHEVQALLTAFMDAAVLVYSIQWLGG
jgi:hypothetical protein